jgi:hypothetical protein
MTKTTAQKEAAKFAERALKSFNRRPFLKQHDAEIQSLDELAQCMELQDFRGALLGEYGLIPDATRANTIARYNLPDDAKNVERSILTRIGEAAKRFCNPLYNYNINGVTREVQTDLVTALAEMYHAEHTAGDDATKDAAVKETIKNARFRETKDVLLAYMLETNIETNNILLEEEKAQHYTALRDEVFTTHDKVFTQRRQAATIDLAIYGKAALLAGAAVATGGVGAVVAAGALGIASAYGLRAVAGTGLGAINSHIGQIASAAALYGMSGFGTVATAYIAKGGFDYLAQRTKNSSHTTTHTTAKWSAGILAYLMPVIAGAGYIHALPTFDFGTAQNGCQPSSGQSVSPHERSLETCPVNTCEAFPKLHGDIRELQIKETYLHHGTPFKGEFHELGLHLDKKEFDEGFVTVKGLYDGHSPKGFDVDKTVVMAEGYDSAGKLAFRQLYDVDAHGKFTLNGFDETQYKNWQITWAEAECKNDTLHLTDLASYTRGKVPVGFVSLPAHPIPIPETPHAHLPGAESHIFDIHYIEIPQNSHEQLIVGVHDSFADGIEYNTKITDAQGDLVEFTQLRHAPGVTDAIQGGYIPEFAEGGNYHLQSWGHDFPQIAAGAEPEFGWYIQEVPLSSGLSLRYLIIPESSLITLPEHDLVAPEFWATEQSQYTPHYHTL